MNKFWSSTLNFTVLSFAILYGVGSVNADTEPDPIKLDISETSVTAKGHLAAGQRITYSLYPKRNNSNLAIQIESPNNEVGFTIWDAGSHLAQPILGDARKPMLGVIKEEMEEVYLPSLTWQGHLINREHSIIVSNEGEKESSFTLTVIIQ